jgi:hypothetical protein
MKKLFFVLIAALTLTSVQSKAQTWGSVLSGSYRDALKTIPTNQNIGFVAVVANSSSFQLLNGQSPYTTTYNVGQKGYTTYYFAFSHDSNVSYYSYTVQTSGSGSANPSFSYESNVTNLGEGTYPVATPIDGGVSLLLGAGVVAHLRRKKLMSNQSND